MSDETMSDETMSDETIPTMVYHPDTSKGNSYKSDGVEYACTVVDESEVDAMVKKGWFKHFSDFPKKKAK